MGERCKRGAPEANAFYVEKAPKTTQKSRPACKIVAILFIKTYIRVQCMYFFKYIFLF